MPRNSGPYDSGVHVSSRRFFPLGIAVLLISAFFPLQSLLPEGALNGGGARWWSGASRILSLPYFENAKSSVLFKKHDDSVESSLKANNWWPGEKGFDSARGAQTVFYHPWSPVQVANHAVSEGPASRTAQIVSGGIEARKAGEGSAAQTLFHFGGWLARAEAGTGPGRDFSDKENPVRSDDDEAGFATTVFYRPWPRRYAGSSVEDTPAEKVIAALEGSRLVDEGQEAYTQFYVPWPGQAPKPLVKPVPPLPEKVAQRPRVIPVISAPLAPVQVQAANKLHLGESSGDSRLSDKPRKFLDVPNKGVPERPPLLFEFGDAFLGQGNLNPGFELATGWVVQPRLWIFGTLRSAVQSFDNGVSPGVTEWANRFDLYANLQLTGTEKAIIGFRPLDRNRFTEFTRYGWSPENAYRGELNADIRTLFFEGDIGSIFPFLDPKGMKPIDYGFSVGRQQLNFQDGIMINDIVDAVGIVRNNLHLPGVSNLRVTAIYGWGELDTQRPDPNAQMVGLFLAADTPKIRWDIDGAWVKDAGSGNDGSFHYGVSAERAFGHVHATLRVNGSIAQDRETAGVGTGVLLSAEFNITPPGSDDNIYLTSFWAIDSFTQISREPVVGGPLATFGILFASASLGNYLSELSGRAEEVAGAAIGYQAFWDKHSRNLTLEIGTRIATGKRGNNDVAAGFQYQQKFGRRIQWQVDGFYALQENRDNGFGLRTEILYQF